MSIFTAERLASVQASPTLAVASKAMKLKQDGVKLIDFGLGEPDFNTPAPIIESAYVAMKEGKTRYTPISGIAGLKKAIAAKFQRENNLLYNEQQIIACSGAKHVIFNALISTINQGDEVIIPAPYWTSYPDMAILCGGVPVFVKCDEISNFKLTAEKLESAITKKTKWLILNSPSNPTGAVYSKEELDAIAGVLLKNPHVLILNDDIYEHLVYDVEFLNILNVEPELFNRTLIVNGVSKSFAMTGWRLGYGAGPEELIANMSMVQSHSVSHPSSISQYAAEFALNSDSSFLNEWRKTYVSRRNAALAILEQSKYLDVIKPNGAFYVFANCQKVIGKTDKNGIKINSDEDLAAYLLNSVNVVTVFGAAFGLSPYLRISYVINDEQLKLGCTKIVQALDELR